MLATATAHPNIALIKYWGKRDPDANLPAMGSLSITLDALATETTVEFDAGVKRDILILNGREQSGEQQRLTACLDALRRLTGETRHARVVSTNDFPTGAGLASSASGYAALVRAAAAALEVPAGDPRLLDIARIGSGSAPRSMLGGFVVLSSGRGEIVCECLLGPAEWPLTVTVAVTTEARKSVSSRIGMERSRLTSPYYGAWVESHAADLNEARQYVAARDFDGLGQVAEHNCLKMHAVMMTSRPALLYWTPPTLACIQAVQELRASGVPVFFTVDAGPQVKAIHAPAATTAVRERLAAIRGVQRLIVGGLGEGARLINPHA